MGINMKKTFALLLILLLCLFFLSSCGSKTLEAKKIQETEYVPQKTEPMKEPVKEPARPDALPQPPAFPED